MTKYLFAPGCALILYKPHLAEKIHKFLNRFYGTVELLLTCCRHTPRIPSDTQVIGLWHKELDEFIEIHKDPETEIIKK